MIPGSHFARMPNWIHVGAIATGLVGGVLLGLGVPVTVDAWATMQQIEAQGVIGQAAYQEEYSTATDTLRWSVPVSIFGVVAMIGASIEYLRGTIKEMSG